MIHEITIYQPWGGLGDNLGHSVIPEMCHSAGIKCYLSTKNAYRHSSIYDLVWSGNPYVGGVRESTDMSWLNRHVDIVSGREWNEVKNIQCRYGFKPENHYPKIYYEPCLIEDLSSVTLVDLDCYSFYAYDNFRNRISMENYTKCISDLIDRIGVDNIAIVKTNSGYTLSMDIPALKRINRTYAVADLKHYCDAMRSCAGYICCNSGQMVLCCTVKNMCKSSTRICSFMLEQHMPPNNYNCYVFKNATYIAIDSLRVLENIE